MVYVCIINHNYEYVHVYTNSIMRCRLLMVTYSRLIMPYGPMANGSGSTDAHLTLDLLHLLSCLKGIAFSLHQAPVFGGRWLGSSAASGIEMD